MERTLVLGQVAEKQYERLATITKMDKESFEPIFEPSENELEATKKPSQDKSDLKTMERLNEPKNQQWLKARLFAQKHGFAESTIRGKTSKTRAKLKNKGEDTTVVTFIYEGKTIEARRDVRTTLYRLVE